MKKHQAYRNRIAAAGAAALATLGSSSADAGLFMDLRATGATTAGAGVVDPKTVILAAPGDTITLGLFARVTGIDLLNNETVQTAAGLLQSVGTSKGNLSGGYLPSFFTAGASQNGSVIDWDSDGDLDIGLSPTSSTLSGKFLGRSLTPTPMPSLGGDVQVGQFIWTYTGGPAFDFALNFVRRNDNGNNVAQAALWFEDGSTVTKNPTNSPYTVGSPVTGIPEPASLGLIALSGIGLLKRRQKRD